MGKDKLADSYVRSHHWIGVDFDNTLAHFDGWKGCSNLGEPLQPMVDRVKRWLAEGVTVKIFTARACEHDDDGACIEALNKWSEKHFGQALEVTCEKDFNMLELWDDRAIQVERNTGRCISHKKDLREAAKAIHESLVGIGYYQSYPGEDEIIETIRRTLSDHLEQS